MMWDYAAGVRENIWNHEGDGGKEREEKKRKGKRCGEQGGSKDRDEVLGGSAKSTIEYVR